MIAIPPQQRITSTIRLGTVYLIESRNKGYDSQAYHMFVVLNRTPLTDSKIIMCWITTDQTLMANAHNRNFAERFIILTNSDYDQLTTRSVINCHTYEERSLDEIISKFQQGKLHIKKEMSPEIVKEIRDKLRSSHTLEQRIERILF